MKTFEFVAISHLVTPMHLVFQDTVEPQYLVEVSDFCQPCETMSARSS